MKYLQLIQLFILLFSSAIYAAPTVNEITSYYIISGTTADMLRQEMNSKSTIRTNGKIFDAHTTWNVNWKFNWRTNNGTCSITKASSIVDVAFTLPKWKNTHGSSQYLINKWERYYKALIQHENGHKNLGIKAANEIENSILSMQSSHSCKTLEKKANRLGDKIIVKYTRLEKQYDQRTNHGMNDGTLFP